MDRVTKEAQVERAEGQARPRRFDRARGLPRARRPDGHRSARRVPQSTVRVQGLQEHARQARDQGHPDGGDVEVPRGPDGDDLLVRDPSAPAKVATKFAKDQEKFVLKGGYFEGTVLDVKGVEGARDHARQGRAAGEAARDLHGSGDGPRAHALTRARRTSCTSCRPRERAGESKTK